MAITGKSKTRAVATRYPVTSGTTAETTKTEGRQTNLIPTQGSLLRRSLKRGLKD